jgi:hypothetical protein
MTKDTEDDDGLLTERIIIPISKAMAEEISNYRFDNRINSKADAVRRLIEIGLRAEGKKAKR